MEFEKYVSPAYPIWPERPLKEKFDFTVEGVTAYNKAMEEYNKQIEEFKVKKDEYFKITNVNCDQFKHDLEVEFGVDKMPRKILDVFFNKAYDDGHLCGSEEFFKEIYSTYEDMIDLLEAVKEFIK